MTTGGGRAGWNGHNLERANVNGIHVVVCVECDAFYLPALQTLADIGACPQTGRADGQLTLAIHGGERPRAVLAAEGSEGAGAGGTKTTVGPVVTAPAGDCPGGRAFAYCLLSPCWCGPDGSMLRPAIKRLALKMLVADAAAARAAEVVGEAEAVVEADG